MANARNQEWGIPELYMTKRFIIIRGPSGSGKTTISKEFSHSYPMALRYEADMFFTYNHVYSFDTRQLHKAHNWCRLSIERGMFNKAEVVILSNTSTRKKEVEPYLELAKEYGYEVEIIRTPGPWNPGTLAGRNIHGVPLDIIQKQIARYDPYDEETEWIMKN
jgi:predicted kinase